jgi:dethiobiotin synthetase
MSNCFFITGIGTGIGKTFVSAIFTEALKADYWKPIQSGDLKNSDSKKIKTLISNDITVIHPEAYRLTKPLSPHASAKADNTTIDLKKIKQPKTVNPLIIEGAGGIMVPLSENKLIIDLIKQLKVHVIVVSQNYLGSINHTLLTVEALKARDIPIAGIVFNGKTVSSSEEYILHHTKLKCLLRVGEEKNITSKTVLKYCKKVQL